MEIFRVSVAPEFCKRVFTVVLEYNGNYASLVPVPGGFEFARGEHFKTAEDFCGNNRYNYYGGRYSGSYYGDMENVISELRGLHPFLISLTNGEKLYSKKYVTQSARSADHARLFLYAEAPPGFAMKNDRFESGTSLVLYVADIFKP